MGLSGFGPEGIADTRKGIQLHIEETSGEMACGKNQEQAGKQGKEKGQKDSRSNPEEDREKAWLNG